MQAIVEAFQVFLPFVLLVSVRTGVAFAALPAPFGETAPNVVRAALGILISLAICTPYYSHLPHLASDPLPVALAGLGEVMVGSVIGLTVRTMLAAAEVAGSIAGLSMGLGFASSVDPMFGEEALPTTKLFSSVSAVIFFVLKGHHVIIAALAATLRTCPPGNTFATIHENGLIALGSQMVAQGLRISAPVVATMVIVHVGTGLVARVAPKVQLFGLTFALATTIGLVAIYFATPSIAYAMTEYLSKLPTVLGNLLAP